jgi:hypothetical protein
MTRDAAAGHTARGGVSREGLPAAGHEQRDTVVGDPPESDPLIATADFTKKDLFSWAKEVLDTPELITIGQHMPFFFSSTARTGQPLQQLFGSADLQELDMPSSYWRAPHDNPPTALSGPLLA